MQPIDDNHYSTVANERIRVYVCIDKSPYLCVFEDPPDGSNWENISMQGKCEERFFRMPPAHGGKVTVWSKEGAGSTFTLHLPVTTRSRSLGSATPQPASQPVREAVK